MANTSKNPIYCFGPGLLYRPDSEFADQCLQQIQRADAAQKMTQQIALLIVVVCLCDLVVPLERNESEAEFLYRIKQAPRSIH